MTHRIQGLGKRIGQVDGAGNLGCGDSAELGGALTGLSFPKWLQKGFGDNPVHFSLPFYFNYAAAELIQS